VVTLHTPRLRSTLFSKQVRRACPVDIPIDFKLQERRLQIVGSGLRSAHGRSCTDTRRILSALPLLLGYAGGLIADFKSQISDF
jgi:hypothetical protein